MMVALLVLLTTAGTFAAAAQSSGPIPDPVIVPPGEDACVHEWCSRTATLALPVGSLSSYQLDNLLLEDQLGFNITYSCNAEPVCTDLADERVERVDWIISSKSASSDIWFFNACMK